MANHASTRTTQLYDRRSDDVTLDDVTLDDVTLDDVTLDEAEGIIF
jgi:hypothetical protein